MTADQDGFRIGVVAHDVDAMLAFYDHVLGLSRAPSIASDGVAAFRVGVDAIEVAGLDELPPRNGGGAEAAIGFRQLVFMTSDFDGVVERTTAGGLEMVRRSVASPRGDVPLAFVSDPDGNEVEVVRWVATSLHVGMAVADVERTRAFYCGALGLGEHPATMWDGKPRHHVRVGDFMIKYWLADDGVPVRTGPINDRAGYRSLTLPVDDVDGTAELLRRRGVPTVHSTDGGGGTVCVVSDPDGNAVQLRQRRAIASADNEEDT